MRALLFIPIVTSLLLLAAHFLRYGQILGVAIPLVLIGVLFVRTPWAARVIQFVLALGALEWARTIYELVQMRIAMGAPAVRMALILGLVLAVTATSALLFQTRTLREAYGIDRDDPPADG